MPTADSISMKAHSKNLAKLSQRVVEKLRKDGKFVTTVESCTGGALAAILTNVPGSSEVFTDGFITYHERSKIRLGVSEKTIRKHSIYSIETAVEMAKAGLRHAVHADIGIGITGVLSRADDEHPEGQEGHVYFAIVDGKKIVKKEIMIKNSKDRWLAKCLIVEKILRELLR